MHKFNSKTYLIITMISLFIGILLHYRVTTLNDFKAYSLYYVPLLLLSVPTLFFWYHKRYDLQTSKSLLLIVSGNLIGVLIIFFVAVARLMNQGDVPFGSFLYNVIIYGVSLIVIIGLVWYFIEEPNDSSKSFYSIIGLAFLFFMFSSLKGFHLHNGNVYGFNGPFMRWRMFWSYMFQNVKYTLVFLSFPLSVYAKYRLFDE